MFTNSFDSGILSFFSNLSSHLDSFNYFVGFISESSLIKGGFVATLIWWLWFHEVPAIQAIREKLLAMIVAMIFAIFIARSLALLLPFRIRPEANPELSMSFALKYQDLDNLSSFPSDHAILFFALATGIWLISRPIGTLAFLHTIFVVCLPRVYLGLHYPTDIIVGALVGIGISLLANRTDWRRLISQPLMKYLEKSPSWFYAGFFLLTFQIGEMFESSRSIVRQIFNLLRLIKPF